MSKHAATPTATFTLRGAFRRPAPVTSFERHLDAFLFWGKAAVMLGCCALVLDAILHTR